jgi:hypothetical protein
MGGLESAGAKIDRVRTTALSALKMFGGRRTTHETFSIKSAFALNLEQLTGLLGEKRSLLLG